MPRRRQLIGLSIVLLAGSATRLPAPGIHREEPTVAIHLLADPLHTGLVFELRWLIECGYVKPTEIGDHKYVLMSWGDEAAYVQKRWLTPGQVYRALFTPTPSVMECIPFDWKVEEVCLHQRVYVAELPRSAGPPLATFLNAHSETGATGAPLTVAASSWGDGRLIRCPERYPYDVSRMCNDWVADALVSAGMPIRAERVLTANGLVRQATSESVGFRMIRDPGMRQSRLPVWIGERVRAAMARGNPPDPPPLSGPGRDS